jgi:tetratricopeptide (TPR) repeat protein
VLPYSVFATRTVAATVRDKPDQYEKLMREAAELDPSCYYDLWDFALRRQREDQAAEFMDKACAADPDSVRVSNHAVWRVRYYLKKGQTATARTIADEAGEVYSSIALESKAVFFETTGKYNDAFEWFAKMEERYDQPGPLISFCLRYKQRTGDSRFEPELQRRVKKLFPKGMEKVSLKDFRAPPTDGVLIKEQNDLVQSAGLKAGDVIVAVYGVRVHTFEQYSFGRDLRDAPELDLIVWQGDAFREFKPSPPDHRFGADFGDYVPR